MIIPLMDATPATWRLAVLIKPIGAVTTILKVVRLVDTQIKAVMRSKILIKWGVPSVVVAGVVVFVVQSFWQPAPDAGKIGGPLEGLTAKQLRLFYDTREDFKHEFTPEEGLGPLFNGLSCYECHGSPGAVGGEGRDVASTGVIRIRNRIPDTAIAARPLNEVISTLTSDDVDRLFSKGGPAIQRKSLTSEFPKKFPADCVVEAGTVPAGTELISLRHAGPVFGFGLIEAIPDVEISENLFKQVRSDPQLAGRLPGQQDPLTERFRIGRFGWKAQHPTIMLFTAEAMLAEHGITTYLNSVEKYASEYRQFPKCIREFLPGQPNDKGTILNKLTYHQAMLAPPPRGPITDQVKRGEAVFKMLKCAVCHTPEMTTAPFVEVVYPNSPAPALQYIRVEALENKPVRAYSDFLLHQMGLGLADGIPQGGAMGGEWRTTPLWGLRLKKFYLHDGRATNLTETIKAHGGQAQSVTNRFEALPEKDKEDLLAFLQSL